MENMIRGYLAIRRMGLCPINEKTLIGEQCAIDAHDTNEAECSLCSKKRAKELCNNKK